MALDHELNHFERGLVALSMPFWGKPRVAAMLRAYLRQVQRLEDDANAVLTAFDVNTADATRLAILGRVTGTPNFGCSLETYRAIIRAKIATNRSRGLESDIVTVVELASGLIGTTLEVPGPATLLVTLPGGVTADALIALLFLLPKARAAGIGLQLLLSGSTDPEETFRWGDAWATTEFWAGAATL